MPREVATMVLVPEVVDLDGRRPPGRLLGPVLALWTCVTVAAVIRDRSADLHKGFIRYLDNPTMRGLVHLPLELVPTRSGVTGTGTTIDVAVTSESLENP
jgi:hypothetical protein